MDGNCYFCTKNQLEQNVQTGVLGVNFFKNLKAPLVLIVYYTAKTPPPPWEYCHLVKKMNVSKL